MNLEQFSIKKQHNFSNNIVISNYEKSNSTFSIYWLFIEYHINYILNIFK